MVTPPPQLNVAPTVDEDAVIVTLRTAHVNVAGGAMLTFGVVIFWVTVVEVDAVHPFPGSVTETEYDPGADTDFVAVVIPPPQLNVAPTVDEDAVIVTLRTVQVSIAGGAMLTFGVVIFCVTVADADAVHPFEGSVTVTE